MQDKCACFVLFHFSFLLASVLIVLCFSCLTLKKDTTQAKHKNEEQRKKRGFVFLIQASVRLAVERSVSLCSLLFHSLHAFTHFFRDMTALGLCSLTFLNRTSSSAKTLGQRRANRSAIDSPNVRGHCNLRKIAASDGDASDHSSFSVQLAVAFRILRLSL